MITDRDIWTAASEVIKSHDDPILFAVTRYDELLDAGDMEGCIVWRRIEAAIRAAGTAATARSPVAWLRIEPDGVQGSAGVHDCPPSTERDTHLCAGQSGFTSLLPRITMRIEPS